MNGALQRRIRGVIKKWLWLVEIGKYIADVNSDNFEVTALSFREEKSKSKLIGSAEHSGNRIRKLHKVILEKYRFKSHRAKPCRDGLILGSLSIRVFETRTATGREYFSC